MVKYTTNELGLDIIQFSNDAWVTQASYARSMMLSNSTIGCRCRKYKLIEVENLDEVNYDPETLSPHLILGKVLTKKGYEQKCVLIPSGIWMLWYIGKDKPEYSLDLIKIFSPRIKRMFTGLKNNV